MQRLVALRARDVLDLASGIPDVLPSATADWDEVVARLRDGDSVRARAFGIRANLGSSGVSGHEYPWHRVRDSQ